jgi:hypothetical protein
MSIKHEKELKSFINKLGSNKYWFVTLSENKQYDVLFMWKSAKWNYENVRHPVVTSYSSTGRIIRKYQKLKLKHWIKRVKVSPRFFMPVNFIRDRKIENLLKNK